MSETICPCCGTNSPEEALYCMRCGEPIKCKGCGSSILANARACIQCGKLVPERESGDSRYAGGSLIPPGYNRLTVHQRDDSYQYDADFLFSNDISQQSGTGEFISHLASFGERASASRPLSRQPDQPRSILEVDGQQPPVPQLASPSEEPAASGIVSATRSDGAAGSDERAIRTVFTEHDGKLELQISDLKAVSQTDYTLRLAHMLLYARKILFNEPSTPRAEVYEVTDFANLPRENVAPYLSRDGAVTKSANGESLSLNLSGLEHARKCFSEIMDQTVPPGKYIPPMEGRPAPKPRKGVKRGDARLDDSQMAAIVAHPETQALTRDISHDVFVGMTVLDKAIVALYGLHEAGTEAEVFYSTISDYVYKVFHDEVDADTIGSALRRATSQDNKCIVHKEGAGYRITPSGMTHVASLRKAGQRSGVEQPELQPVEAEHEHE